MIVYSWKHTRVRLATHPSSTWFLPFQSLTRRICQLKKSQNNSITIHAQRKGIQGLIIKNTLLCHCNAVVPKHRTHGCFSTFDRCSGLSHRYNSQTFAPYWFPPLQQQRPTTENLAVTRKRAINASNFFLPYRITRAWIYQPLHIEFSSIHSTKPSIVF